MNTNPYTSPGKQVVGIIITILQTETLGVSEFELIELKTLSLSQQN